MWNGYSGLFQSLKRVTVKAYRRIFSRRSDSGLTTSEVFGLYIIDLLDGPTIKDFAGYMGISQPNATYKINALVEKGYVDKVVSDTDRRECHLFTTKKCKKLLKGDSRDVEEIEAALKARFTEAQLEQAKEVFDAVLEILEESE